HRAAGLATEPQQFLIARNLCTRSDLFGDIRLERRRAQDLAQNLDDLDECCAIGLRCEIVDADLRWNRWIGAFDAKRTPALRAQLTDRGAEPRKQMQLLAHLVGREWQEVNLDIRRREARVGLEERA